MCADKPAVSLHVAAVIMAAGRSTRMRDANKLLALLRGKALVRHVAEAALASSASPVVVVVGHQAEEVRSVLAGLDLTIVDNPRYAQGMSTSLAAGLRALPPNCAGALILLGDMPKVSTEHLDRLIASFADLHGDAIIAPVCNGKRGNPVLWPASLFGEMLQLDGDVGARSLLVSHAARVREIDIETDAILADVDTPEELARLHRAPDN